MNIELTGTITRIKETEYRGKFKKQQFHLLVQENQKQVEYGIDAKYNKVNDLVDRAPKDQVKVTVEIEPYRWSGNIRTNLNLVEIIVLDDTGAKEKEAFEKRVKNYQRQPKRPTKINIHE